MAIKVEAGTLDSVGSHHVATEWHGHTEEVYGYAVTAWRGQPVRVTLQAVRREDDRAEVGGREWRIWATDARYVNEDRPGGRGEAVTDTARARLTEACRPLLAAWLDSDAYRPSARRAWAAAIVRDGKDDAARLRQSVGRHSTRISGDQAAAIEALAQAYEAVELARRAVLDADVVDYLHQGGDRG